MEEHYMEKVRLNIKMEILMTESLIWECCMVILF